MKFNRTNEIYHMTGKFELPLNNKNFRSSRHIQMAPCFQAMEILLHSDGHFEPFRQNHPLLKQNIIR